MVLEVHDVHEGEVVEGEGLDHVLFDVVDYLECPRVVVNVREFLVEVLEDRIQTFIRQKRWFAVSFCEHLLDVVYSCKHAPSSVIQDS